jgi:hypothetical protein
MGGMYGWPELCAYTLYMTVYLCKFPAKNTVYTPYMTIYLVNTLPRMPCIHRPYAACLVCSFLFSLFAASLLFSVLTAFWFRCLLHFDLVVCCILISLFAALYSCCLLHYILVVCCLLLSMFHWEQREQSREGTGTGAYSFTCECALSDLGCCKAILPLYIVCVCVCIFIRCCKAFLPSDHPRWSVLGFARTVYIRCIYDMFGREIYKCTVIHGVYSVYKRFWPTLVYTPAPRLLSQLLLAEVMAKNT